MATPPRSFSGRVAVITGGARGIGLALARAMTVQGMRVAIGDLDGPAAQRAAAELGPDALGLPLDVTDRPAFTAFLDTVEARLGPLDVLVNNAGIMPIGPFADETDLTATRVLEVNLHAVLHGAKEAVRRMQPRGRGHIVNLASIAGKAPSPGGTTYSATKHAVVGLSESLRQELHGTGIHVCVVVPGFVATELAAGTREIHGIPRVTPEQVASAVMTALAAERPEVYVPRRLQVIVGLRGIVPRTFGDTVERWLGNGALERADRGARAAYEARAARSAPAVEGGSEPERAPAEAPAPIAS